MTNITLETHRPGILPGEHYINMLEDWTADAQMLPLNPESISAQPLGLLAFNEPTLETKTDETLDSSIKNYRQLLGHIGVTSYEDKNVTIGGLIVNPAERRKTVGSLLLNSLLQRIPLEFPDFIHCKTYTNYLSLEFFEENGGVCIDTRLPTVRTGCNWVISLDSAIRYQRSK